MESKARILKYQPEIKEDGTIFIDIPKQSRLLNVDYQNYKLTFWICVNDSYEKNGKNFKMVATGEYVPEIGHQFVKTVFIEGYVWHIWEHRYNKRDS